MSYSTQFFLIFTLPVTLLLVSFCAARLFSGALTLRKDSRHPFLHCYCIFSLLQIPSLTCALTGGLHAWLLQLAILAGLLILFKGSLRRKFAYFIFFMLIFITIETTSIVLYTLYFYWKTGIFITNLQIDNLHTPTDLLLITAFYFLATIPIMWKIPKLLEMYKKNPYPVMEIIFPIQATSLIQILPLQHQSSHYSLLIAAYWLLCLLCYLPLLNGLKRLYQYEKSQALLEKQLELAKEQLDYSKEAQNHYQDLRKWNHDIENHLFALSYLTSHGKYKEASDYLVSIELGGKQNED